MAISVESVNASSSHTTGTTTIASVVVTAGDKIVVTVAARDTVTSDRTIASVTRNGQSFTNVVTADTGSNCGAEIWQLDNPNTGTHDVTITHGGTCGFVGAGATVLIGTADGAAEDTDSSATTAANPSLTLTTTAGAITIDACCYNNQDGSFAFGASQTEVFNIASTRRRAGSYKTGASAGSTTMSQTNSSTERAYAAASFAVASSGSTTDKSLAGTITPAGALVAIKSAARSVGGTVTPAGAVSKSLARTLAGVITPAATAARSLARPLVGVITPAGALAALKQAMRTVSGTISPESTLTGLRVALRTLTGALSPVGVIQKSLGRTFTSELQLSRVVQRSATFVRGFAGTVTPESSLARLKVALLELAGSLALSGAFSHVTSFARTLSSVITPTAAYSKIATLARSVSGEIVPVGGVFRQLQRNLNGTLSSEGSHSKLVSKLASGVLTPTSNNLNKALHKLLVGVLTLVGVAIRLGSEPELTAVSLVATDEAVLLLSTVDGPTLTMSSTDSA